MQIFPALLMLHLIALVLMAGTTLIDFVQYQTFWKIFDHQKEQAAGILAATAKFPRLIGIGGGLLIITGVGMIALTHGILAEQLWFRIKIVFILLLIGNGTVNGTRVGVKLRKMITENGPDLADQLPDLKSKLRRFYLVQLGIFLIIIFLSAYKFN